jgi:hypothetical protein
LLDWLRVNEPATKTAMKKAGLGQWQTIEANLEGLLKEGQIDAAPGRQADSLRYFVVGNESSNSSADNSRSAGPKCF